MVPTLTELTGTAIFAVAVSIMLVNVVIQMARARKGTAA